MRSTLGTNGCSYVLHCHPTSMIERSATLDRSQLWLSAILVAEMRFGAAKLASPRFSAAVEARLSGFDERPWQLDATQHYAQKRSSLERAGKPVGVMDMLIAAHAMAEDSPIIIKNAREFIRVPGQAVEEEGTLQDGAIPAQFIHTTRPDQTVRHRQLHYPR